MRLSLGNIPIQPKRPPVRSARLSPAFKKGVLRKFIQRQSTGIRSGKDDLDRLSVDPIVDDTISALLIDFPVPKISAGGLGFGHNQEASTFPFLTSAPSQEPAGPSPQPAWEGMKSSLSPGAYGPMLPHEYPEEPAAPAPFTPGWTPQGPSINTVIPGLMLSEEEARRSQIRIEGRRRECLESGRKWNEADLYCEQKEEESWISGILDEGADIFKSVAPSLIKIGGGLALSQIMERDDAAELVQQAAPGISQEEMKKMFAAYQIQAQQLAQQQAQLSAGKGKTPGWVLPVAIGGGFLLFSMVLIMALRK